MRLYSSEKEAQVLQLALATLVAKGTQKEREEAQVLLKRIADCLTLQLSQRRESRK